MEGNESVLNSYYPHHINHHHHQQQQQQQQQTTTTSTTAATTTNGMFTNTGGQNHQNHNPQQHVSSPHYSSSEPSTTTQSHHVFSPNSGTAGGRGFLSSSTTPQQPPPPPPPLETVKRKRGRPRKYGTPEIPSSSSTPLSSSSSAKQQISSPLSSPPTKKDPSSGSSKKSQLVALGNAGQGFTPHIITVAAGEDVSQKIMSFVQQTKCAVCILSASGSISNASLRQPAMLGGNVSYEGRFEILSLSGSFLHNEIGGTSSRTGGLSVCLSSTDGRIIGGGVGGPLRAAAPVQVIAGSFFYGVTKNALADKKHEAALDKSPPQVGGASITSVTFRNAPDSSGRIYVRENDDHQFFGGHFMLQPRGMDVTSPQLTDWRGGLDARSGASIDFAGTTDHGECQSPEDGNDD